MTSQKTRLLALFTLYVTLSSPAHAYLDPATGSIMVQAIIGAAGTGLIYYRMGKAKVLGVLQRIFIRSRNRPQD